MVDTHAHITPTTATAIHHEITLNEYTAAAKAAGISKIYVFLNPFISGFLCPHSPKHKVEITSGQRNNEYVIKCVDCGCIVYRGVDLFYSHNISLADECSKSNLDVQPIAFLASPYKQLNERISEYEETGLFAGYKLHPTICHQSPADIPRLTCNRPIIIHSGVGCYEDPENAIQFARNYPGPVIIAHCARFKRSVLTLVREMDNVWIDTSPFIFLWNLYETKPHRLYLKGSQQFSTPKELFYNMLETVGEDKVVFASDEPFGNLKTETEFIKSLALTPTQYRKITHQNAINIFEDF